MLEEIVNRTGLSLGGLDHLKFDLNSTNPFTLDQDRGSDGRTASSGNLMGAYNGVAADDPFPGQPEPAWTGFPPITAAYMANGDFMYGTTMVDEDPEKWLNGLLAQGVLGMDNVDIMDNMPSWAGSGG